MILAVIPNSVYYEEFKRVSIEVELERIAFFAKVAMFNQITKHGLKRMFA